MAVLFILVKADNELDQAANFLLLRNILSENTINCIGNAHLINPNLKNNFFVFAELELEKEEYEQEVLDNINACGMEVYEHFCLSQETKGVLYTTHTNPDTTVDSMVRYCYENIPSAKNFLSFFVDYKNNDGEFRTLSVYLSDKKDERREEFEKDWGNFTREHPLGSIQRNSW